MSTGDPAIRTTTVCGFASTRRAIAASWCAGSERSRRSTPSSSAPDWCVQPPMNSHRVGAARGLDGAVAELLRLVRGRRGQLAGPHAGDVGLAEAAARGLPVAWEKTTSARPPTRATIRRAP